MESVFTNNSLEEQNNRFMLNEVGSTLSDFNNHEYDLGHSSELQSSAYSLLQDSEKLSILEDCKQGKIAQRDEVDLRASGNAFSTERNAFSSERNAFSTARNSFSTDGTAFSAEKNAFRKDRNGKVDAGIEHDKLGEGLFIGDEKDEVENNVVPVNDSMLVNNSDVAVTDEGVGKKILCKRKKRVQRKAPGAPKRGKSPYIIFSMEKRNDIKAMLPSDAKVTDIMRALAQEWAKMSDVDKIPYSVAAVEDKQRYDDEMMNYEGPLRIPATRRKKNPNAPKSAACAFLYFSKVMRKELKKEHPMMKNTQISKQLGRIWAEASEEYKKPYADLEKKDRARYKKEMEIWNFSIESREDEEIQQRDLEKYRNNGFAEFDSISYGNAFTPTEV